MNNLRGKQYSLDRTGDEFEVDLGNGVRQIGRRHSDSQKHLESPRNSDDALSHKSEIVEESENAMNTETDEKCDYFCCALDCLQKCRIPQCLLLCLSIAAFIQGMVVNGFINAVITSLERRYSLRSSESGLIASFYDIFSLLCVVPVSYIGGSQRKSRWLAFGFIIMACGSFVFAIPQLTSGYYVYQSTETPLCNISSEISELCEKEQGLAHLNNYKWVLWLGQALHGIGATPLYTLGVTYLDDSLSTKSAPVYLGIFFTMSLIGPAAGYLFAGAFLEIYVDPTRPHPGLTPEATTLWVGAWWIGFLISGVCALLISIPIMGFPAALPGSHLKWKKRENEAYGESEDTAATFQISRKDFLPTLKILITNPTFVFLCLSGSVEAIAVTGISTFGPKYLESLFTVTSGMATMLIGIVTIPAGGLGMLGGGVIVRAFKLRIGGILKFMITIGLISIPFAFGFLIGCDKPDIAGITSPYLMIQSNLNTTVECNADCGCRKDFSMYKPVCGSDKTTYFSPCHAGCSTEGGDSKYYNCSCLPTILDDTNYATEGTCSTTCSGLPVFLFIFAILVLLTFLLQTPNLTATLRAVPSKQRSFAMGMQWVFMRLLGSIPGPLIFGGLIDVVCREWAQKCSEKGNCVFYYPDKLQHMFLGLILVIKFLSLVFLVLGYMLYKPPALTVGPIERSETQTEFDKISTVSDSKLYNASVLNGQQT